MTIPDFQTAVKYSRSKIIQISDNRDIYGANRGFHIPSQWRWFPGCFWYSLSFSIERRLTATVFDHGTPEQWVRVIGAEIGLRMIETLIDTVSFRDSGVSLESLLVIL
jgi:hypothetical protein